MADRPKPRPGRSPGSPAASPPAPLDQLADLLGRRDRSLGDYYECAKLVLGLRPAAAGYGAGWVEELCGALEQRRRSLSRSLAYRLIRFAERFPGPAGAARVRALDGRVSWECMFRVLAVEDAGTRDAILRRAAAGRLSGRAVVALIAERTGYRRPRGGRAGAPVSGHPNRALKAVRSLAARWPGVYTAWAGGDNPALQRAARLNPARVTDAFLADLAAAAGRVKAMAAEAAALAEQLAALHAALRARCDKPGHGRAGAG